MTTVVGGFRISERRYAPDTVLPLHPHEVAVIGAVLGGEGLESLTRCSFELGPRSVFFRPAFRDHSNRFGRSGARICIVELPDTFVAHLREVSAFTDEAACVRCSDAAWI